jgi:hypothetical protein
MNEPWKHFSWKKPDTKRHMQCDSIDTIPKISKLTDTEGSGEWRMYSDC